MIPGPGLNSLRCTPGHHLIRVRTQDTCLPISPGHLYCLESFSENAIVKCVSISINTLQWLKITKNERPVLLPTIGFRSICNVPENVSGSLGVDLQMQMQIVTGVQTFD